MQILTTQTNTETRKHRPQQNYLNKIYFYLLYFIFCIDLI